MGEVRGAPWGGCLDQPAQGSECRVRSRGSVTAGWRGSSQAGPARHSLQVILSEPQHLSREELSESVFTPPLKRAPLRCHQGWGLLLLCTEGAVVIVCLFSGLGKLPGFFSKCLPRRQCPEGSQP